ncbi:MAG: hypothetical protein IMX00_01040 [Limnochordales bacterium]|nr:hypothetical protein [Limnochordales bacterium]
MRIHYNLGVAQALMALQRSNRAMAVARERVVSGRRINRAADDAAGLAIAQRLKAQILGMNQAVRNAMDGISLLATADAGIGQLQQIVHRLRELGVQAASETLTWRDRLAIQREADELTRELSAIANRTEFNGKNLLGGGLRQALLQVGANAGETVAVGIDALDAKSLGLTPEVQGYVIEGRGIVEVAVDPAAAVAVGVVEGQGAGSGAGSSAGSGAGSGPGSAAGAGVGAGAGPALPSGAYEVRLHQGGGWVVTAGGNLVLTTVQPRQFTLEIAEAPPPGTFTASLPVAGAQGEGVPGEATTTLIFRCAYARGFHLRLVKAATGGAPTSVSFGWDDGLGMNVLTVTLGTDGAGNIAATWQEVAAAINRSGFGIYVNATGAGAASETARPLEATLVTQAAPIATSATFDAASGTLRVLLGRNERGEVDATWADVVAAINGIQPPPGITAAHDPAHAQAPADAQACTWPPKLLTAGISFSLVDMNGNVVATQATLRDDNSVVLADIVTLHWNTDLMAELLNPTVPSTPTLPPGQAAPTAPSAWGLNVIGVVTGEKGVLVDTREHAQNALPLLDHALARLSGERSHVGALQNGLERIVANLQLFRENLTAARSRIEDSDLAAEAAQLSKHEILTRTSATILAAASAHATTHLESLFQTIRQPAIR